MKQRAAFFFIILWICIQLAGCAISEAEKADTEETKLTLPFMAVGEGYEQAFTDVIEAAVKRFNAENPYHVEIETQWYENEQYKERLAMLMTQNDVQGIFFTWEAGFLENYVKSGKVASASEALASDPEWYERFAAGAFDAVTFDGEIYAVPMGQAVIPVYYNKKIFEENQVFVPKTWEEFLAAIDTFCAAGITPIAMGFREPWVSAQTMLELSGGVGGKELFDDTVSGAVTWEDERWVETGETFQELVKMGAFQEDFLKVTYDDSRLLFTEQKAAMYPMGTWDTAAVISGFGGTENLGVFLMPPKYEKFRNTRIKTFEKFFAVSEKCENKKAAFAFLRTLTDEMTQEDYVTACGALPVTKVSLGKGMLDPVTEELLKLQEEVEYALTPLDRQFGENLGGEFNRISLEIAGGADVKEQLLEMQAYAEKEKKRDVIR